MILMTEKQAKEGICTMIQPEKTADPESNQCVGSACPLWKWSPGRSIQGENAGFCVMIAAKTPAHDASSDQ